MAAATPIRHLEIAKRARLKETPQLQIEETTEYEVFGRIKGNRPVSEPHVKDLMEKMRQKDLKVPIQINQNFEVIDGQHRLEARRRLGLPVYYYWVDGLEIDDVHVENTTNKPWSNDDYCNMYVELGNQDYATYKWFRQRYGIPHRPTVQLLSGGSHYGIEKKFKEGGLVVKDLESAKRKAEMLLKLRPYFEKWKDAKFIAAFLTALNRDGFDFVTFMHRVEVNPKMLVPCVTVDQYLQVIEDVYNYKAKSKIPIRYGSENGRAKQA